MHRWHVSSLATVGVARQILDITPDLDLGGFTGDISFLWLGYHVVDEICLETLVLDPLLPELRSILLQYNLEGNANNTLTLVAMRAGRSAHLALTTEIVSAPPGFEDLEHQEFSHSTTSALPTAAPPPTEHRAVLTTNKEPTKTAVQVTPPPGLSQASSVNQAAIRQTPPISNTSKASTEVTLAASGSPAPTVLQASTSAGTTLAGSPQVSSPPQISGWPLPQSTSKSPGQLVDPTPQPQASAWTVPVQIISNAAAAPRAPSAPQLSLPTSASAPLVGSAAKSFADVAKQAPKPQQPISSVPNSSSKAPLSSSTLRSVTKPGLYSKNGAKAGVKTPPPAPPTGSWRTSVIKSAQIGEVRQ